MKQDLFASLDGTPAHALVIIGLVLVLYAPLIPAAKWSRVARADAATDRADTLVKSDLAKFAEKQEQSKGDVTYDEARTKADEQRKATESKREELDKTYEVEKLKREKLDAQVAASGTRSHLYIRWLGQLMLVLGLLVMTLQSEGTRQKVILIILLVVLFSALTGVNVDFTAQGHMGQLPADLERAVRAR